MTAAVHSATVPPLLRQPQPQPQPQPQQQQQQEQQDQLHAIAGSRLAWVLFILLNGTLFMRPAEIVPQLEGLPIYNVLISGCLLAGVSLILPKLQLASLAENPITVCVLGILPSIVLSLLAQGDTWSARMWGIEFLKTFMYYLLLVALVNTPARISRFMLAIAIFSLVLTGVALLSYHKIIDLTTVSPYAEAQFKVDPETGEHVVVVRIMAAGIYANPNDLARIIAVGITISLFAISRKVCFPVRLFWLAVMVVLGYGLHLTHSRGGLLGMIAGLVVLFHAKFGAKKGGMAILFLLPVLILFGGRQTDIDTSSGTGQLRIKLWSNGLVAMRSTPIFGIGTDRYFRTAGNHAHNSFIEAFVEMGIIGGTFYTGAFFLATTALYRLKSREMQAADPELWRLRPYVLSLIVGTIVGQFSSSREYSQPTYMILGLATAYLALAARRTPASVVRFTPALLGRLYAVGVGTLVFFHLYTKFNAKFG